jgi:adenine phosphoribosyltransferase
VVVDDLLATGGTVGAIVSLLKKLGAEIVEVTFLIELTFLKGRDKLDGVPVYSIVECAD